MKKVFWLEPTSSKQFSQIDKTPEQKKRIVLLDLYWSRDKDPRVSLGHASLLAALKRDPNVDVRSLIFAVNEVQGLDNIAATIAEHLSHDFAERIDLGIGAYIWNEDLIQKLLPRIRGMGFNGRIILGGPQISYAEGNLEKIYPLADVFVRGNGEEALCQLVSGTGNEPIAGVHYAGTYDSREQARAELAALPSPLLSGEILLKNQKFLRWETQRGCQFKCSFCQHRQKEDRQQTSYFLMSRLSDEIEHICDMGVKEIAVLDPVFNSNIEHAIEILRHFRQREFRGRLSLQCRAELVTDQFLDALQGLDVCLEFGLQTTQKNEFLAIDRPNNMAKVDDTLKKVRERKIDHEVSLIFGLPEQTVDSFINSVAWCLERKVPVIKAFPLLLLRGTKLDLERQKWGLKVGTETMPNVEESNTFCRNEWLQMERISQVLSDTEYQHPSVKELLLRAKVVSINSSRFQPHNGGHQ
jgi:radical SAM superfamily enzyme YgiQ (UPF0313 family)